jgi:hypothetical protein
MTELVVGPDAHPPVQPLADVAATDRHLLVQNDHRGLNAVEASCALAGVRRCPWLRHR